MKRLPAIIFIVIGLVCLNNSRINRFEGDSWCGTVQGDGYGYYAYLPCVFIYHRFDYLKTVATVKKLRLGIPDRDLLCYFTISGKGELNKCYVGTSLLMAPFFLIAYFLSTITHQDIMGGYSPVFMAGVSLAAVFYLLLGLFFIRKLMKEYEIPEIIILFTLLAAVFGTNLFYYTTLEQSMSHVYSFSMMSAFLYYAKKSITDGRLKYMIGMSVALALLALIRPINPICIAAIPFLAGSFDALKQFILRVFRLKTFLILASIVCLIYSLQPLVWHLETGSFFVWSYRGEKFDFAHPHLLDILFSYRKGLFVYTPLMFVALAGGLFMLFKRNLFSFFSLIIFFLVITFVLSSWWNWYYGGSFGLRAYIDFYPLLILSLGLALYYARSKGLKIFLVSAALFCVYLNLVQTYQYVHHIISYDSMNKERYWRVFLKTGPNIPGLIPFPDSSSIQFSKGACYSNNFEHNTWGNNGNITNDIAHSGKQAAFVSDKLNYSPTFECRVDSLPQDTGLYVYITVWVNTKDTHADAGIVVDVETRDRKDYFWKEQSVMDFVYNPGEWQLAGFMTELPKFSNPDDELRVYVLGSKGITYIDDMSIRFGTLKRR